ncbi:aminopeptidase P family protein [Candidatus Bathyarchaeota archaeon]|nr:aminopeptidase P family protein [Candidatus Bathyarchaeota archaeon]
MKNRVNTLKGAFEKKRLDGYIVADETNILYFTGFLGAVRLLVPKESENILYVYRLNYEEAKQTAKNCRVEPVKRGESADQKVADQVKSLKLNQLGFDAIDASAYMKLAKALKGIKLKAQSKLVWALRRVKDETELKYIRKAAELTSEGMKTALETIKPGLREYEVAAEIEYAMRRRGSGGVAFDTIVASGPRSAFPHGGCTDRTIRRGDLVVIDIGAKHQHYRADLTRTVTVGKPSSRQVKIHKVVREAQNRAFQSVKAGVKACDVDAVARRLIEKEGYGEYFVHGLGHGVGLDIHEPPALNPKAKGKLKAGNVVTVEPGIYITDFGGVRIEDTVLVGKSGAERLTEASYVLGV